MSRPVVGILAGVVIAAPCGCSKPPPATAPTRPTPTPALIDALRQGKRSLALTLIVPGPDLNAVDDRGETALHIAASAGDAETVSALLAAGADASVRDRKQHSPLHSAAAADASEVITLLLQKGADINAEDWLLRTPLAAAADGSHMNALRTLAGAGADPLRPTSDGTSNAVNWAAASPKGAEATEWFLEHGVSLAAARLHGESLLGVAARSGSPHLVEYLLRLGENPDLPGDGIATPRYMALTHDGPDGAAIRELIVRYAGPDPEPAKPD